ncbi:DUF1674 domain-containing protein, partial [Gluconacetobacter entanii]
RRAFIQHIKPLLAYLCQPQKFLVKLFSKSFKDAAFLKKAAPKNFYLSTKGSQHAVSGHRDHVLLPLPGTAIGPTLCPMSDKDTHPEPLTSEKALEEADKVRLKQPAEPNERGGPKGPEPTRYNDWTVKGRCIDF